MMTNKHVWIKRLTSLAIITVLVGSGLSLQVKPVQAASIILVTDFLGDDPTKSACTNAIDDCSLRGAIMHVNADTTIPKPDYHIQLAGATYTLTNHGANENGNVTGDLDIQYLGGSVYIEGASAATSIIDGDLADRVIHLYYGSLTLSNLSIKHGNTSALVLPGAGIYAYTATSLSLFGVDVSDNVTGHSGGGIFVDQATLFMYLCSIRNNQASGGGGGLAIVESTSNITAVLFFQNTTLPGTAGGGLATYDVGTTNIYNSVFNDNTAEFGGGFYNGIGHTLNIYDSAILENQAYSGAGVSSQGEVHLERAYVSGNIAGDGIGGLELSGLFTLIDVTIANNSSYGSSVGIFEPFATPTSGVMDHVTITGNTSTGGWSALNVHSGTVSIMNTIINATDGNAACALPNFSSILNSADFNIASDASCNLTQIHDHPSTDPQLATPGYYGGMLIASPLGGSIAIDNANPTFLPGDIDQRGALRLDGDLNGTVLPDIGAAEFLTLKSYMPILKKP